ncbi:hypothetical protein QBC38DRAFT_251455 [Podospora fimiseda]|uniref:Ecp2 effector protein domain-containing protein n=1 Tax=Podospora fimiseda TaxID=252190 RepID=A0AAN7BM09_9PEZI|nr:hypothetical protein QBC38DRAFT_251455 [Podospora fimiseda]
MKFSLLSLLTLFATLTSSTPLPTDSTPTPTSSQDIVQELWTIHGLYRLCNPFDTICTWNFQIHNNVGRYAPVPCSLPVVENKEQGIPASRNHVENYKCGPFDLSSGWSGEFGEEKGFTTLTVADVRARLVVQCAFADGQVGGGKVQGDLVLVPRGW